MKKRKEKVTMLVHTKHHLWGREKKTKLTENEQLAADIFFAGALTPTEQCTDYTMYKIVIDGEKFIVQYEHPMYYGTSHRPLSLKIHKGCGPRVFGTRCVILRGGRLDKPESAS